MLEPRRCIRGFRQLFTVNLVHACATSYLLARGEKQVSKWAAIFQQKNPISLAAATEKQGSSKMPIISTTGSEIYLIPVTTFFSLQEPVEFH